MQGWWEACACSDVIHWIVIQTQLGKVIHWAPSRLKARASNTSGWQASLVTRPSAIKLIDWRASQLTGLRPPCTAIFAAPFQTSRAGGLRRAHGHKEKGADPKADPLRCSSVLAD